MKKCCRCKEAKPFSEFHKNKAQRDGLQAQCKPCLKLYNDDYHRRHPGLRKNIGAKFREKNPGYYKRYSNKIRLNRYGLTEEEWFYRLFMQDNRCSICNKIFEEESEIRIDHSHQEDFVRGLLCNNCNVGLGFFYDNPDILRSAASYVINTSKVRTT
jgi:hypothetical protein